MSAVIDWLKAELAKAEAALAPAVEVAVDDAEAIGSAALGYIKTNGLQDLYQLALTLVAAAVPGASWTGILADLETHAVADGKQLMQGAAAVVAAQAQADLIAAGKLLAPAPAAPPATAV